MYVQQAKQATQVCMYLFQHHACPPKDGEEKINLDNKTLNFIYEKLKNIKICDPAIGSGAFQLGMLNIVTNLSGHLRTTSDKLLDRVDALLTERKLNQQEISNLKIKLSLRQVNASGDVLELLICLLF